MTDQTPFVPPGGALPRPAAPPPAFAPPAGFAPPTGNGPPPAFGPPPPPSPRRKVKPGVVIAIVAGSLVLAGGLVAGVVAFSSFVSQAIEGGGTAFDDIMSGDPLVAGDEASPVAVVPMDCGGCFTDTSVESTLIDDSELDALGLTETLESWYPNTATYDSEANWYTEAWEDAHGDPDECFVTFPQVPISILEPADVEDDGSVVSYTGMFGDVDEWSTLGQSVRIFAEDDDAVQYMAGLPRLIDACEQYHSGSGETYWHAAVTPAPALNLPDSVAAIGWVEDSGYSRYYSFDLQRGNLVVRTAVSTADEISELEFRALVEHYAVQLSGLAPAPE